MAGSTSGNSMLGTRETGEEQVSLGWGFSWKAPVPRGSCIRASSCWGGAPYAGSPRGFLFSAKQACHCPERRCRQDHGKIPSTQVSLATPPAGPMTEVEPGEGMQCLPILPAKITRSGELEMESSPASSCAHFRPHRGYTASSCALGCRGTLLPMASLNLPDTHEGSAASFPFFFFFKLQSGTTG